MAMCNASLPCQLQTTQVGRLHQCSHQKCGSSLKSITNSETMLQILYWTKVLPHIMTTHYLLLGGVGTPLQVCYDLSLWLQ